MDEADRELRGEWDSRPAFASRYMRVKQAPGLRGVRMSRRFSDVPPVVHPPGHLGSSLFVAHLQNLVMTERLAGHNHS